MPRDACCFRFDCDSECLRETEHAEGLASCQYVMTAWQRPRCPATPWKYSAGAGEISQRVQDARESGRSDRRYTFACDHFGIPSTSHWTGAAIIVKESRTKTFIVTR